MFVEVTVKLFEQKKMNILILTKQNIKKEKNNINWIMIQKIVFLS